MRGGDDVREPVRRAAEAVREVFDALGAEAVEVSADGQELRVTWEDGPHPETVAKKVAETLGIHPGIAMVTGPEDVARYPLTLLTLVTRRYLTPQACAAMTLVRDVLGGCRCGHGRGRVSTYTDPQVDAPEQVASYPQLAGVVAVAGPEALQRLQRAAEYLAAGSEETGRTLEVSRRLRSVEGELCRLGHTGGILEVAKAIDGAGQETWA